MDGVDLVDYERRHWSRRILPLHVLFVELFGRDHDAPRVLAEQAGLSLAEIAESPVTKTWLWNVLAEAHWQRAMGRLVEAAIERKRERREELEAALLAYAGGGNAGAD